MKAREIEACAERLPEHLRAPFSEYMAEGVEFDMVEVQLVYDLRPLNFFPVTTVNSGINAFICMYS